MLRKLFLIFFVFTWISPTCAFAQAVDQDNSDSSKRIRFDSLSPGMIKIDVRRISDTLLNRIRSEDAYWYANLAPEREQPKPPGSSIFEKQWFRTLMWVIIILGFTAVVIAYLASGNIRLFRKSPKKIIEDDDAGIVDDIFAINYDKEIGKAVESGNFRLAVRLMYLQTLKRLSDKGLIQYKHERTNSEYLAQLYRTPHYRDFFRLTRNFEYTWYGQFDLSDEAFTMMQNDFSNFKTALS